MSNGKDTQLQQCLVIKISFYVSAYLSCSNPNFQYLVRLLNVRQISTENA